MSVNIGLSPRPWFLSSGWAVLLAAGIAACEGGSGSASAPAGGTVTATTASATASTTAGPLAEGLKKLSPFRPPAQAVSRDLVELGLIIFFDPRLAGDNKMSCATCHDPKKGWADGLKTGTGHRGKTLARNTPTVINVDYRLPLFWDGRAKDTEEQALMPIGNPDEMDQDLDELAIELQSVPEYVARFKRAFPGETIQKGSIAKALAAFERTLLSTESPYDRHLQGEGAAMSEEAVRGLGLFVGKAACVKCHDGPQLTDNSFHNIGVAGDDPGRNAIVPIPLMKGAFKTPGLRDVELTAPYFHDGSAPTLEAVVDHYNRGGDAKNNLDPDIKPLGLTSGERADLVAFMKALTGKTPSVEPPTIPGSFRRKDAKAPRELMKMADGMLDELDKLFASLSEQDWDEMRTRCEKLLSDVETIEVTRLRTVPAARRPAFRAAQGELILALEDLLAAIRKKEVKAATKSYDVVRERCNDCHEGFRPDRGKEKH